MVEDVTTIRVTTDLREKLKKLGKKGDTYQEIIERLIEVFEANEGGKD